MILGYGIDPGVAIETVNDILADRSSILKQDIVLCTATADFLLQRGQLLKRDTGQDFVPVIDKAEILDDTLLVVNLNETVMQAGGTKISVTPEATLIQQRLKPADVPTGFYNSGNMIIRKELTI